MTRNECKGWIERASKIVKGYCTYSNLPIEVKERFVKVGDNCGSYGWNWDCYYSNEYDTVILDGYRNFPAVPSDKLVKVEALTC